MAFNTLEFLYFFIPTFIAYWLCKKNILLQNIILLAASYFFYGYTNIKLPFVLFMVSIFTWFAGFAITKSKQKKIIYLCSILLIIVQLFFFKYFNWIFSIDKSQQTHWYNLVNTLGISYFSLAAYSYLTDVYRNKISAQQNIITLLSYFSFFPHLLSGPIPIAYKHLPQFSLPRTINIDDIESGFQRIIWGLFKKVIIAGMLGQEVNYIFYNHNDIPFLYLWLGIILYSFQVYMDFSGYSDMAWGLAKLLGFTISPNFNSPFISTSIAEFWRRWHLSLSNWLREYVYIPIGARGNNKMQYCFNILIIFGISGLWHGANSTYVLWGLFNGLLFVFTILFLSTNNDKNKNYSILSLVSIIIVFISISFTRVLFRSPNFTEAIEYYISMFNFKQLNFPDIGMKALIFSTSVIILEFLQKNRANASDISNLKIYFRIAIYVLFIILIVSLWPTHNSTEYIYFKF